MIISKWKITSPIVQFKISEKIRKHHPYVDHLRALHRWWKPILVKTVVGRIGLRLVSLWGARWWVLCTKDRALCTSTMNNHRPPLLLLHLVLTSVPQMNWHQSDFWCLRAFSGAHFGANSGAMACGHHFQRCNHQYCIHGVKRHLCDMHCGKRCRVRLKNRINLFVVALSVKLMPRQPSWVFVLVELWYWSLTILDIFHSSFLAPMQSKMDPITGICGWDRSLLWWMW